MKGAKPRAVIAAIPAPSRTALPIAAAAVTPSSAIDAPIAAAAVAAAISAGRGTRTAPDGDSVSRSSITASARGSVGPGTNVRSLCSVRTRPRRSFRAGIRIAASAKSADERTVSSASPSARIVTRGLSGPVRPPRSAQLQRPVNPAIEAGQPQRRVLAGPGEREVPLLVAFGRKDPGDVPGQIAVEFDRQRGMPCVEDGDPRGSEQCRRTGRPPWRGRSPSPRPSRSLIDGPVDVGDRGRTEARRDRRLGLRQGPPRSTQKIDERIGQRRRRFLGGTTATSRSEQRHVIRRRLGYRPTPPAFPRRAPPPRRSAALPESRAARRRRRRRSSRATAAFSTNPAKVTC